MKIGIVSDTHGNIVALTYVYNRLVTKHNIEMFVHLGDNYEDMDTIYTIPEVKIVKVPGLFTAYYQNPSIPNRIIEEINGWKILFTHSHLPHENDPPTDISPTYLVTKEQIKAVMYGHTHIPKVEAKDNVWWVNPGHLKKGDKRGYPPTYAIAEFKPDLASVTIIELESGNAIIETTL